MRDKNPAVQLQKTCAMMVLSLIFPTYTIQIDNKNLREPKIIFQQEELKFELNKDNYDIFIEALNLGVEYDGAGVGVYIVAVIVSRAFASCEQGPKEERRRKQKRKKACVLFHDLSP